MTAQRRLLGGRYEIGGILGYGGMAEVHRGSDLRLGRDVAVKMLRTDLARDETFLTRFRREAQNAASLNHPSIVAVYDTGEDSSTGTPVPYIVMEYVEGRTLKELLVAEGRLTPRRACEMVADVCAALDFSHRHQIIHRDVKPGNVMLATNGQVKVMDFGIARAMASGQATMTQTSAVIGTAQYLSPEQALGKTVDARSDVYATGCLLYELLCGDPPFTGDNPVSVAYQHVREPPTPPSRINPDVPPAVDAIVLKALAKNAANRYQSAGEMRDDLERAIAGRPVMATPVMTDEDRTQILGAATAEEPAVTAPAAVAETTPKRRTGRNVLITALVVLLVAGLAVGGYFLANADKVTVPSVVGETEADAVAAIEKIGLLADVEYVDSLEEQKGLVIKQDPKGQTTRKEGATVKLQVGAGPKRVQVPDLSVYNSVDAAESALEKMDLKAEVKQVASDKPEGEIVGQDPAKDTEVTVGETVIIEVSDGSIKTVPDVRAMTEQAACDRLVTDGFECDVQYVAEGGDIGTVIEQSPVDGTKQSGGAVTITVVGVTVPDFTTMTVDAAHQAATDLDLVVEPSDAAGDWNISAQDVTAGDIVKKGTTVTVTAQDGPLP